ncbi:MAG: hypothetical protein ACRYG8_24350 [Janthinobacterium lividum]
MTAASVSSARIPGYALVTLGILGLAVGMFGDSLPLDIVGCVVAFVGCQVLLWSGVLALYPRKRAGVVSMSVLTFGLAAFLIGIRLYGGPAAWSG